MLRVTEIKLPLDHPASALPEALQAKLGLAPAALKGYEIVRRGYDARRRSAIALIYTVDVTVADEAAVLARLGDERHVGVAPDMRYRLVARAPADLARRPSPRWASGRSSSIVGRWCGSGRRIPGRCGAVAC
jgi:hypothetical protein